MKLNEKNIFLLDGSGAMASAILSGIVLPYYAEWVGLPKWILQILGLVAFAFAVYSLACYFVIKKTKPAMLLVIISANLFYCALLVYLLFSFFELTVFGKAFFITEVFIVLLLVLAEVHLYRTMNLNKF